MAADPHALQGFSLRDTKVPLGEHRFQGPAQDSPFQDQVFGRDHQAPLKESNTGAQNPRSSAPFIRVNLRELLDPGSSTRGSKVRFPQRPEVSSQQATPLPLPNGLRQPTKQNTPRLQAVSSQPTGVPGKARSGLVGWLTRDPVF